MKVYDTLNEMSTRIWTK